MPFSRFNIEPVTDISLVANIALAGLGWISLRRNKRAHYEATHDDLTGALNRRGLEELLAKSKRRPRAILSVDGTNQKAINDNLGHRRGDEAIIGTANVLEESLRPGDVLARVGGDEFRILLDTKQRRISEPLEPEAILSPVMSRIGPRTQAFLEANPDLQKQGFDIAVGGAVLREGMSLDEVDREADAAMDGNKATQHEANGRYR